MKISSSTSGSEKAPDRRAYDEVGSTTRRQVNRDKLRIDVGTSTWFLHTEQTAGNKLWSYACDSINDNGDECDVYYCYIYSSVKTSSAVRKERRHTCDVELWYFGSVLLT